MQRYDYYTFFEDRARADTYVKGLVCMMSSRNVVVRMIKVECFEELDALRIF